MNIVEVAAGLVFRNRQVLITQRFPGSHQGGLWEFPGGKREPAETFEQCLVRELREELAIEIEVGNLLEEITHAYPDKTVRLRFYRCEWKQHEPQALGCHALNWVFRRQLRQYAFPAADARLLSRLEADAALFGEPAT